jgi:hypothetical protein
MPRNPTSLRCMRVRSTASSLLSPIWKTAMGAVLNYPSRPRGARQNGRKGGFFVADLRYQQG